MISWLLLTVLGKVITENSQVDLKSLWAWVGLQVLLIRVLRCDGVIYIKKHLLGLQPCYWHRAPKTISISYASRVIEVSFLCQLDVFWTPSKDGALTTRGVNL